MDTEQNSPAKTGFVEELAQCWQQLPNKGLFFTLLVVWLVFFHVLGNATFGYIDTRSLLSWMWNAYYNPQGDGQDSHGGLIPVVVIALMWWKRKELLAIKIHNWWPGLLLLTGALLLHVLGYMTQQPRISIVALFAGIYALMGLAWGPQWLRASFFPFFLCVFCVPITSIGEPITVPLRLFVSKMVAVISNDILGMSIIRQGNVLFNSAHTYRYEVAAECSGLRSLIAIIALSTIYAFMNFDKNWKRLIMIGCAVPLAMAGNVLRMMLIIITADTSGQSAGNFVHENWFFSLIPYFPAIAGVMFLGWWMREPEPPDDDTDTTALKPKPA